VVRDGPFAHRDRPGWADEVAQLIALVRALPPARTLDIGCGTGFLTSAFCPRLGESGVRWSLVDTAQRASSQLEEWQERRLNDGTTYRVYKRFFKPPGFAEELGGGSVVHDGRWFVVVAS
jgi:trans-aconitate methyltransferase